MPTSSAAGQPEELVRLAEIRFAPLRHYEPLSPVAFSIENSLPLVKLGQIDYWGPDPSPRATTSTLHWGRLLFGFQRLQVLFGWILATLFVAAVTGIVQKH